jgi:hypothetical protein
VKTSSRYATGGAGLRPSYSYCPTAAVESSMKLSITKDDDAGVNNISKVVKRKWPRGSE